MDTRSVEEVGESCLSVKQVFRLSAFESHTLHQEREKIRESWRSGKPFALFGVSFEYSSLRPLPEASDEAVPLSRE